MQDGQHHPHASSRFKTTSRPCVIVANGPMALTRPSVRNRRVKTFPSEKGAACGAAGKVACAGDIDERAQHRREGDDRHGRTLEWLNTPSPQDPRPGTE